MIVKLASTLNNQSSNPSGEMKNTLDIFGSVSTGDFVFWFLVVVAVIGVPSLILALREPGIDRG